MNFGEALTAMKLGEKVTRKSWKDCEYIYINSNNQIRYMNELEVVCMGIPMLSSQDLLANDWQIIIDVPKTGDIVQLKGMGEGIITKCRVDGKYTVMIGDGNFLVCDIFNFELTGKNHRELVDDIKNVLDSGE